MRDDVVHLAGDAGALLVAGPHGAFLGAVGEQGQLAFEAVGPLAQALHEAPPGADVQAHEDGRGGHAEGHHHGEGDHRPEAGVVAVLRHVAVEAGEGDDQRARERGGGEDGDDPSRHLGGGEGVEADDAEQEAHFGGGGRDRDQDDGHRPASAQDQRGAGRQAYQPAEHSGESHVVREGDALQHALQGGHHGQHHVEHHAAPSRPPPRPHRRAARALLHDCPRCGHTTQTTGGGHRFSRVHDSLIDAHTWSSQTIFARTGESIRYAPLRLACEARLQPWQNQTCAPEPASYG